MVYGAPGGDERVLEVQALTADTLPLCGLRDESQTLLVVCGGVGRGVCHPCVTDDRRKLVLIL